MPEDPSRPSPGRRGSRPRRIKRFDLSGVQLVATALGAIVATFAASYLGVAGTVLGAALFSVVAAVSKEVLGKSLSRTGERVREAVPVTLTLPRVPVGVGAGVAGHERAGLAGHGGHGGHHTDAGHGPGGSADDPTAAADTDTIPPEHPAPVPRSGARPNWVRIALVAGLMFLGVLACVTVVEAFAGRPVSDIVRGDSGKGTTVFGNEQIRTKTVPPTAPTVTVTVTPKIEVTTPTVTQTAPSVTETAPGGTTTVPSSPQPSTTTNSSTSPTARSTTPSASPTRSTRSAP